MSDQPSMPRYNGPVGGPVGGPVPLVSPTPVIAPTQVTAAFWLYIAAAAVSVISIIVSLATIGAAQSAMQSQVAAQGNPLPDSTVNAIIIATVVIGVVISVITIAGYVLFAFFVRRGANWARIVMLILTVLSLIGVAGGYGLGAAHAVLGIIATVLIFLKPASEYFRVVKENKLIARGR
jgi:K+-sensing histidine kinase KdpD